MKTIHFPSGELGAGSVREIFDEKYYTDLDGGILEAFGRLFKNNVKLYVYPMLDAKTDGLVTVENLEVPSELRTLYRYLVDRGYMEGLKNFERNYLRIYSRDVLAKIQSGEPSWESMVPPPVAELVKTRELFGYR